jgi:uncharacterized membrane protein YeaQ/YmgE (transglycosylase-associated protein family)
MNLLLILLLFVVLLAVAGAFVGGVITLLWWMLTGLVIGAVARLIVSGTGGMGVLSTILAGIAGAIGGGLIASALDLGGLLQFIIAVLVAAVVVAVFARPGDDRRVLD